MSSEPGIAHQPAHRVGLVVAVFDHQRSARRRCELAAATMSRIASSPSAPPARACPRLVTQVALREMGIGGGDIGRVADDQVEALAGKAG
jgi:hypothetical protein